jgi:hypothetical protein
MTEFELIMTLKETSDGIALDFEFFLTITFALIVVSYAVGERLGKAPRIVISSLYLATVFLLFVRYQGQASQALFIATKLSEMKSDYPVIDMVTIMWTRRFIFLAGTFAALFALFKPITVTRSEVEKRGT